VRLLAETLEVFAANMKRNRTLIAVLGVALVSVAVLVTVKHRPKREAELRATNAQPEAVPARSLEVPSQVEKPAPSEVVPAEASRLPLNAGTQAVEENVLGATNVKTQQLAKVQKPKTKKVVQDPLARDALAMVGVDPDAEMYWFAAIQDPTLPKSERQDLIDDLKRRRFGGSETSHYGRLAIDPQPPRDS